MMLLAPMLSYGSVEIHEDKFSLLEVDMAKDHFWSRLYDWKAWAETNLGKEVALSPNYVALAYEQDMEAYEGEVSEGALYSALGDYEGDAALDFLEYRAEIDSDSVGGYSGLVTVAKTAMSLPDNVDLDALSADLLTDKFIKADDAHINRRIDAATAHGFIDPVHAGHKYIDEVGDSNIFMTVMNMASEYYNCSSLNTLLVWKSEAEGVSSYDGNFRLYTISTVRELNPEEIAAKSALIEGAPVKVFVQNIIYSSSVMKSGLNYVAFYDNGENKAMSLTSVMISTSKVKELPGKFINGISDGSLVFSGINFEDGVAKLNSRNVDLEPTSGKCSKGLGQGVAKYAYGLARRLMK